MMSLLILAPTSAFVTPALRLAGAPARVHLSHMAPSITISMQSNSEEKGRAPLLSLSSKLLQQVRTSTENNCIRTVLHSILNYQYFQYNNSRAVSAGAEEHAASEGTAAKELWHRRTSQGARAACPPRYVIRTYIHTYTHTYIHTQTHTSCVPRYHTKNITQSQTKNNRRTKRRKIGYIM